MIRCKKQTHGKHDMRVVYACNTGELGEFPTRPGRLGASYVAPDLATYIRTHEVEKGQTWRTVHQTTLNPLTSTRPVEIWCNPPTRKLDRPTQPTSPPTPAEDEDRPCWNTRGRPRPSCWPPAATREREEKDTGRPPVDAEGRGCVCVRCMQ